MNQTEEYYSGEDNNQKQLPHSVVITKSHTGIKSSLEYFFPRKYIFRKLLKFKLVLLVTFTNVFRSMPGFPYEFKEFMPKNTLKLIFFVHTTFSFS